MQYFGLAMIAVGSLIMFFNSTRDIGLNREHLQDIRADVSQILLDRQKDKVSLSESIVLLEEKIKSCDSKLSEFQAEINQAQDHMAKITKQQAKLKNTIFPRQINPKIKAHPVGVAAPKPMGAIPVEILGTDVKLVPKERQWKKK